ncbi:glycosyltransferase [Sphingobacterium sp. DK4209]|uniref:Glycosyltransferase n=1 Tax=Sphingobacterium zhuxiongii TaxID=2662364 RepID=A0A5Q0QIP3_9SPHI|nr:MULTISPECIES: glycosyltransferase family 4 protein [unclassified Sphingobacterium]MVZ65386.1 glycosyltransferase [Sphingobacterium sp. DK4209]QGA27460.1 glycosyltransferase [Sphingobacterium sp. dk4302]
MRILIIHNQYQHIGGEDFVMRQEMDILLKDHEVELYSVKNVKGIKGYLQYLSYPFNWSESKKIRSKIEAYKPDIIHIHNMHYALGPLFILHLKKLGIPMLMTLHNFRLICPSATLFYDGNIYLESIKSDFPWDAVKKRVLENSYIKTFWTAFTYWLHRKRGTFDLIDKYVILSDFAKRIFEESSFPVSIEKFVVKPNFVVQNEPDSIVDDQSFIYIGRLSEEKGIIPLLHAWKATNYPLKIFGTGPLQSEVEQICNHSSNIRYMGFQTREVISRHLSGASALVVPSICYEAMPLSVLEAYAAGIPVLASNIGILSEMVVPLYTGLLFDPHHHTDIVRILSEWTNLDEEKKITIRANCRKEYQLKYERSLVMNELIGIYQELLEKKKGE